MTPFDIALLVVIGISAVMGLMRGLLKEVLSLITWIAAFLLALTFGPTFSAWFPFTAGASLGGDVVGGLVRSDTVGLVVGFVAVFILTLIAGALVQWGIGKLVQSTGLTGTDRLLGLVFGAGRGMVLCIVLLIAIRPFAVETEWWRTSQLREHLLVLEDDVLTLIGESRRIIGNLSR
jgi:membrane protein required for colicin V production